VAKWSQRAAAQGNTWGLFRLGNCYRYGEGTVRDRTKALELFKYAAELDCCGAQSSYGDLAYGSLDWERYYWLGRASLRDSTPFWEIVFQVLPSFEKGEKSRILHTVVQFIKEDPKWRGRVGRPKLQRMLDLHEAILDRARLAIACWSVVDRRCGVAKDIRVMIAKMVWEEA
jgi:hypothetical protein